MKKGTAGLMGFGLWLACLAVGTPGPAGADAVAQWDTQHRLDEEFRAQQHAAADQWQAFAAAERAAWEAERARIARKWQQVVMPSREEWVEYDSGYGARGRVDFKDGAITVEAVVPETGDRAANAARQSILARLRSLFGKAVAGTGPLLDKLIRDRAGHEVTPERLDAYIAQEVAPQITVDPKPQVAGDGTRRERFSVRIAMVPEHLDRRARRYVDLAAANARRFDLAPELIMAVIHTESYFNPLAVSPAGAYGLMQIVPASGGRDAYRFLYGGDWRIASDYLYAPAINVELGSAYLHLLKSRYFGAVADPEKNRYLTICAYNWGPGAVQGRIVKTNPVASMSDAALYELLRARIPAETRDYLAKVTKRMALYRGYF